jgi:hypothetical protein
MSKKISAFFNDEASGWISSLNFYDDEIKSIEKEMEDIINRNSVINIAAKVEVHQVILGQVHVKLLKQQKSILEFLSHLKIDNELIDDQQVTDLLEQEMRLLALGFKQFEQEFIDIKYHCNIFLIDILKK